MNLLDSLRVARWDGSLWRDHGHGGTTGNVAAGTVMSSNVVPTLTYFTLATAHWSNPLPIELLGFEAWARPGRVDLRWVTASEQDNRLFVVERSSDALAFGPVLEVPGAGNSNAPITYSEVDPDPLPGISYYRLRQVDLDGTATISPVVAVVFDGMDERSLVVFPNPAQGAPAWLLLPKDQLHGTQHLQVRDAAGRVVAHHVLELAGTASRVEVPNAAELRPGAYLITLGNGQNGRSVRFLVQ
ncbi:MAG: hypothetical protein KBH07_04350 [Flavobacteriales bacterium]|nr:hypothetical protein [Flavobacteriales bacterium]MBP9079763.1 hypothetical protein [Flavobacteriales bacterium]